MFGIEFNGIVKFVRQKMMRKPLQIWITYEWDRL